MPLSLLVTAANTPDAAVFEALLDDIPKVCTPRGGRRHRPVKVHADKAYDNRHCRSYLTRRGIKVRIARRGVESSTRLGRHRWKAERSIAWLAGCRRLRVRYDRDSERFFAFAMLGCARLCYNRWVSTVSGPQQPRSPPHPQFRNVLLRPAVDAHHRSARSTNRVRPDRGSTQPPLSLAASFSSSHRSASTLRANTLPRIRPAGSRYCTR
jgi:transposase